MTVRAAVWLATVVHMLCLTAAASATAVLPAHATGYDAMVADLRADEDRSPLIRVSTIGLSAASKRAILLVTVGTPNAKTPKIMVLCRQHGDEPSGTEGALQMIKSLSEQAGATKELLSATLYIVPMVNPDGATAGTRLNGKHADLNRDWGIFHQTETAAVQRAVEKIRPVFILDVHSWDMIDPFQQICIEGPRGGQVAAGLLLPVADLQARAAYALSALSGQSVAATTYGTYSDGSLAHRFFLHHDHIASLLFETGPGLNYGTSLATRSALVSTLLNWLLTDTSLHPDAWRRLAAAEPQRAPYDVSVAASAVAARVPRTTKVKKDEVSVPWIVLAFGCLLLGWIAVKGHELDQSQPERAQARFRRLMKTQLTSTFQARGEDRKCRSRLTRERLALLKRLQALNRLKLAAGYTDGGISDLA